MEYSQLEKSARNGVEKHALRAILLIDKSDGVQNKKVADKKAAEELRLRRRREEKEKKEIKFKDKLENDKKERETREKKAQDILCEFDKSRKEGKERHDERVQKLESEMCSLLNISPETWITKDKKLDELIKDLQSHHDMSGDIRERKLLDDNTLLQKCSGGRALQGVFLTKKLSDQLEERHHLLDLPGEINITNASESETTMVDFHSSHEEDDYKKTVVGRGVAVSASAPIYGNVAMNLSGAVSRRTEDEEEHAINTRETYSSSIEYSTTNVASYSFNKTDLKLTYDAKHDLKELAKLIDIHGEDHADVDEKCVKFFKTYGSHATLGPFNFGGQFWWTCSSKGFSKTKRDTVKKMQSDAISASAGVTFLGFGVSSEVNIDKTKGRYEGKCTEDTLASTRLQIKISGGPPEATNISKWKNGLVTYIGS